MSSVVPKIPMVGSFSGCCARAANGQTATNVRLGSKADVTLSNFDVRFTPESGHSEAALACLLWATSGLMQCSKNDRYSITSSERA
jgi:hypothetical protein